MLSQMQAVVLGAIQGLTEFFPISSSAHLVLIPWFFKWDDPGLAFDVALHLGTLLALLAYYRRNWVSMGTSLVRHDPESRRLLFLLVLASVPGGIVGFLFEKQAETLFRSLPLIAVTLASLGLVLWVVDVHGMRERRMGQLTWVDALIIGASQALAIIPGVSRSGATITAARALGIERQDAANFSFLMATPIIAGAGFLELRKILDAGMHADVVAGFASSAMFSLIAIVGLIAFVRNRTYRPFAWYRLVLAAAVLLVFWARV